MLLPRPGEDDPHATLAASEKAIRETRTLVRKLGKAKPRTKKDERIRTDWLTEAKAALVRAQQRAVYLRDAEKRTPRPGLTFDPVLVPIAADPLRESEAAFIDRAARHWRARAREAQALGSVPVSEKAERQTADHLSWLLRNQLHRESTEKIAESVGRTRQTVEKAINRWRRILQLTPRH